MAFKEKIERFGSKAKQFWKEHWKTILLVTGGTAITGGTIYGMYKHNCNSDDRVLQDDNYEAEKTVEELTAWNKDWDEMATQFELLTHQPLGSFENGYTEEEGYVDPLEGNCFIIAGCNSLYNDSPDKLDFYVLDNEGYYHRMPDDLYGA